MDRIYYVVLRYLAVTCYSDLFGMIQRLQAAPPNSTASIGFKNIQLFKEEILGIGSYGKVYRAKCDHLLCAAKIIHETLFDPTAAQQMPRGREHRLPIRRFEQECEFLNTIRHPNVIQYLGMCRDPDTGLPVLLMELMDDSLTHFLEIATRSIPYHAQVNICHDIALALTFLHANGIVHRDLSSNNVLLISNVRAKVTDFGMAKLGDLNPRASHLTFTMTLCPGADVYMPPEAIQAQPFYTEKIDIFSFGVIVVQVLTRQFPKPGDRMQRVEMNHSRLPRGTLMVCIPEIDRRQDHIHQIDPNNTLLPIALDCLKDRDIERPSAQQLCERVAALKESDEYAESVKDAQMTITQKDMQERLLSLREEHTREIQHLEESQAKVKQSMRREHSREIQNLQKILLREQERIIAAKEHEIQSHSEAIAAKERAIQELRLQLEQNTHKINKKEQATEELEGQLKQNLMKLEVSSKDLTQLGTKDDSWKYADVTDIKLAWREGKPAPQRMYRCCNAAVNKTIVYFNIYAQKVVYCYNTRSDLWTRLPDCPNICSSFTVINNMLTAIGGAKNGQYSNKVYSLKEGGAWVKEFPPMPTKRASATAVCTESSLIVIAGDLDGSIRCPIEVMNIASHQWSIATDASIKEEFRYTSGVICGDQLYVLGAFDSKLVYTCSLSDLFQSCQPASDSKAAPPRQSNIWRQLADLPLFRSTCVSLCGHLLAIGGKPQVAGSNSTKAVYAYKPTTDSWEVVSQMSVARRLCFAVTLPTNNKLMVVGGRGECGGIDSVESANLI